MASLKDLFVVTHTESIHHVENKVGGWYDTDLTPRGQRDAEATAERLAMLVGQRRWKSTALTFSGHPRQPRLLPDASV